VEMAICGRNDYPFCRAIVRGPRYAWCDCGSGLLLCCGGDHVIMWGGGAVDLTRREGIVTSALRTGYNIRLVGSFDSWFGSWLLWVVFRTIQRVQEY